MYKIGSKLCTKTQEACRSVPLKPMLSLAGDKITAFTVVTCAMTHCTWQELNSAQLLGVQLISADLPFIFYINFKLLKTCYYQNVTVGFYPLLFKNLSLCNFSLAVCTLERPAAKPDATYICTSFFPLVFLGHL